MGLNWSEGLKAAGEGLGQLAGYYSHEEDQERQEMRDAAQRAHAENLLKISQRYQTQQQQQMIDAQAANADRTIAAGQTEARETRGLTRDLAEIKESADVRRYEASERRQEAALSAQTARDILAEKRYQSQEELGRAEAARKMRDDAMDQAEVAHEIGTEKVEAIETEIKNLSALPNTENKARVVELRKQATELRTINDMEYKFRTGAARLPTEKQDQLQQLLDLDIDPMLALRGVRQNKTVEQIQEEAAKAPPPPATTAPEVAAPEVEEEGDNFFTEGMKNIGAKVSDVTEGVFDRAGQTTAALTGRYQSEMASFTNVEWTPELREEFIRKRRGGASKEEAAELLQLGQ